jgi:pimeloyl-ACP methyl ester carboxylesterase
MQPEYDDDDIQKKVNDEGFSPQKFGGGGAGDDSDKRFVMRNGIRFEKRSSTSKARNPNTMPATIPNTGGNSFFSRLMSSRSSANSQTNNVAAPDEDFCADSLIKLSHGITAYRLIEPSTVDDENADTIPVIVCLHGQYNCSYMWADVVDLLCDCERGPNARVLVFDFYGRGRSPWTGVPITLDVLVVQTKELLDCK